MSDYNIYVHIDGLEKESAMAGAGTASTGADSESEVGSSGGDRVLRAAKKMVSFAAIKSTADQIANYAHSTISLRTGAVEYEQRVNAVYSAVSQTVGAGAALVTAGLTGGLAGVAVVALGLAANGVRQAINIAQRENTLRLNESVENVSIGMQNIRAGTVGRRSGTQ